MQPQPSLLKEPEKTENEQKNEREKSFVSERPFSSECKKHKEFAIERKTSKDDYAKNKVKPSTSKLTNGAASQKKTDKKKEPVDFVLKTCMNSMAKSIEKLNQCHNNEHKEDRVKKREKKVSDITNKHRSNMSTRRQPDSLKDTLNQSGDTEKKDKGKKRKEKTVQMERDIENKDLEVPSMSFEEYLSYDLEAPKRKKRSCNAKDSKGFKLDQEEIVKHNFSSRMPSRPVTEALPTLVMILCTTFVLEVCMLSLRLLGLL